MSMLNVHVYHQSQVLIDIVYINRQHNQEAYENFQILFKSPKFRHTK